MEEAEAEAEGWCDGAAATRAAPPSAIKDLDNMIDEVYFPGKFRWKNAFIFYLIIMAYGYPISVGSLYSPLSPQW